MTIGRLHITWDRLTWVEYGGPGALTAAPTGLRVTIISAAPIQAWRQWRLGPLSIRWRTSP